MKIKFKININSKIKAPASKITNKFATITVVAANAIVKK